MDFSICSNIHKNSVKKLKLTHARGGDMVWRIAFIALGLVGGVALFAPNSYAELQSGFSLEWNWGKSQSASDSSRFIDVNHKESQILHVTSDMQSGFSDFKVVTDDDNRLVVLRYYSDAKNYSEFSAEQVRAGVVLIEASGYKVLTLKSTNLNIETGGVFEITYLTDGIFNKYGKFNMELTRVGSTWELVVDDRGGRRSISQMFLEGRKAFGKWIGIKQIVVK